MLVCDEARVGDMRDLSEEEREKPESVSSLYPAGVTL
jgi:hypothetical protein